MIKTYFQAVIMLITLFLSSTSLSAHGYVLSPASRSYMGSLDKDLLGYSAAYAKYGSIINEPQSLEAPKGFPAAGPADGLIASAGGLYGGVLDIQTADRWTKTNISSGVNTFVWKYTAYHATSKWHYYMTKPGWDPNKPIKRADLELIGEIEGNGLAPQDNTPHSITVPANRQGYHVILAVWDVADTVNAFYNVIDVNVQPGGSTIAPPATPTGLTKVSTTSTSAVIRWASQTDAVSYNVFRNGNLVQTVHTSEFNNQGLTPDTTYSYEIQAKNSSGILSAKSAPLSVKTDEASTPVAPEKPTKPGYLHSMGTTETSVSLMWAASTHSEGITKYEVFANGIKVGETTQTSFLHSNLSPNTQYKYTVKAIAQNSEVSESSNELVVKTKEVSAPVAPEKPTKPSNLHSMAVTETSVSLMWSAATHSEGISKYEVFSNGIKVGETTQTSFLHSNLSPDTQYKYTVKAIAQNSEVSELSNEFVVKTKAASVVEGESYCGAAVYNSKVAYPKAQTLVFYNCKVWKNKWYANPGDLPGSNIVWEEVSICTESPSCSTVTPPATFCGYVKYDSSKAYATPQTKVFFDGKIWENKWYANPGESPANGQTWRVVSECNEGGIVRSTNISVAVSHNKVVLSPETIYNSINSIDVINLVGTKMFSSANPNKENIDISNLPNGVYFVVINHKDGTATRKTIKK